MSNSVNVNINLKYTSNNGSNIIRRRCQYISN